MKKSDKSTFTYFDLLRYRSLRSITLCMMVVFIAIHILYYAPLMLIDEFGFDFYLNGIVVNLSELITYPISYFVIIKLKRRRCNLIGSALVFFASFCLIFLHSK
jgi:hypothetical protein